MLGLAATLGVLIACAPAPPGFGGASGKGVSAQQPGAPKGTLKMAWGPEPVGLNPKIFSSGPSDSNNFNAAFISALAQTEPSGASRPLLARILPTLENGDLVVNADSTMVTVYRLREQATWHDGVPLTAHDLVFGHQVYADPEIPVNSRLSQNLTSTVEARDDSTLVITWKQPYFRAGRLTFYELVPLPRHLLEEKARTNKADFAAGPEWTTEFVGNGPFRVERWEPGVGVIARANLAWLLGPPKLEALDIRFVLDSNTVIANLLSGEADYSHAQFFTPQAAVAVRDQWSAGGGYLLAVESALFYMEFQYREVPNWQRAVVDLRVRQALLHAIDREGLAEAATGGLASVANMFISPPNAVFEQADRAVVKYPHDPSRAAALLAEAGWRRDGLGSPLKDARGQPLSMPLWVANSTGATTLAVILGNWKDVGIQVDGFLIPPRTDDELVANFPGALVWNRPANPDSFAFTSNGMPTAENRWQGQNHGSLRDAEADRLQNLVLTLVDQQEWQQAVLTLQRHMSETLGAAPLHYQARVIMAKNKLQGVQMNPEAQTMMWNIYEWELTD